MVSFANKENLHSHIQTLLEVDRIHLHKQCANHLEVAFFHHWKIPLFVWKMSCYSVYDTFLYTVTTVSLALYFIPFFRHLNLKFWKNSKKLMFTTLMRQRIFRPNLEINFFLHNAVHWVGYVLNQFWIERKK